MKAEIWKDGHTGNWRWGLHSFTAEEEVQRWDLDRSIEGWAFFKFSAKMRARKRAREIRNYTSEREEIDV